LAARILVGHDNTVPAVIRILGYSPTVTIRPTEFDHIRHYAD
jgi:hypothetical protein